MSETTNMGLRLWANCVTREAAAEGNSGRMAQDELGERMLEIDRKQLDQARRIGREKRERRTAQERVGRENAKSRGLAVVLAELKRAAYSDDRFAVSRLEREVDALLA